MPPGSRLIPYLLRILFAKNHLLRLRRLFWTRKTLILSKNLKETHGILFLSPAQCFARCLIPQEIVQVEFAYRISGGKSEDGDLRSVSRFVRLALCTSLSIDEVAVGRNDMINIFGLEPVEEITVTNLVAYRLVPSFLRTLSRPDSVRVSLVHCREHSHLPPAHRQLDQELKKFFKTPGIYYSGDFISIVKEIRGHRRKLQFYFQFDSSTSPCIVDVGCSVYQSSDVHSPLPYSGQFKEPILPRNVENVVNRVCELARANDKLEFDSSLVLLLYGSPGSGLSEACSTSAIRLHRNLYTIRGHELWDDIPAQSEKKIREAFADVQNYAPCLLKISSCDVIGYDEHSSQTDERVMTVLKGALNQLKDVLVVFTCTPKQLKVLPERLRSLCMYALEIEPLTEEMRREFLEKYQKLCSNQMDAAKLAQHTTGFTLTELHDMFFHAEMRAFRRNKEAGGTNDYRLTWEDVEWAIDYRNKGFADSIGAAKIPSVKWTDVGGLEETKKTLKLCIESNIRASGQGLKRSGIILFGPPGCGKTLLAKAVATEYRVSFLSVKGPELLNKYVGQSEENLRNVFERARDASPCIVFFDELDSLAPRRGKQGDSGGVMDRIVSQLLAELDALQANPMVKVFVMAATNRADLLDPALLSPGRFDKIVNVEPSIDVDSKLRVLETCARKKPLGRNVNLRKVAELCEGAMSGAELNSLIQTATNEALKETVLRIENGPRRGPCGPLRPIEVVRTRDRPSFVTEWVASPDPRDLPNFSLGTVFITGETTEEEAEMVITMEHLKRAVQFVQKQKEIVNQSN